jgi:hypothetical protein
MSVVLFIIVVTRKGKEMAEYFAHHSAWVCDDGSFGYGHVAHFDVNALDEDQWEVLENLGDNDKYDYVLAVLNNQDLSQWEDK